MSEQGRNYKKDELSYERAVLVTYKILPQIKMVAYNYSYSVNPAFSGEEKYFYEKDTIYNTHVQKRFYYSSLILIWLESWNSQKMIM